MWIEDMDEFIMKNFEGDSQATLKNLINFEADMITL